MRRLAALAVVALAAAAFADEPKPSPGLVLSVRVEPAEVVAGNQVKVTATFANRGEKAVRLFVPERADVEGMGRVRLVAKDGAVYEPSPWVGQTMWTTGIQGEIREIAPGGEASFSRAIASWIAARGDAEAAPSLEAMRAFDFLPPGTYEVRLEHAQPDDTVPVGLDDFQVRFESQPGLWTGTATATPSTLRVLPSQEPRVVLTSPDAVSAGEPWPIEIRIENPSDHPIAAQGAVVLSAQSKMYGGGLARLGPAGEALGPNATADLRVEAGGALTLRADLSLLDWWRALHGAMGADDLYEEIPDGLFYLTVDLRDGAGSALARGDGRYASVRRSVLRPPAGLRLVVRAKGGTNVEVALRNEGTEAMRVPKRLWYPHEVCFAITDPDQKKPTARSVTSTAPTDFGDLLHGDEMDDAAVLVEGLSWDGGRFDHREPLRAGDIALLAPGAEVSRTFDLGPLVDGGLPADRWRVQAFWRNAADGRRQGVPAPAVARGSLASEPVVIDSRAR